MQPLPWDGRGRGDCKEDALAVVETRFRWPIRRTWMSGSESFSSAMVFDDDRCDACVRTQEYLGMALERLADGPQVDDDERDADDDDGLLP